MRQRCRCEPPLSSAARLAPSSRLPAEPVGGKTSAKIAIHPSQEQRLRLLPAQFPKILVLIEAEGHKTDSSKIQTVATLYTTLQENKSVLQSNRQIATSLQTHKKLKNSATLLLLHTEKLRLKSSLKCNGSSRNGRTRQPQSIQRHRHAPFSGLRLRPNGEQTAPVRV